MRKPQPPLPSAVREGECSAPDLPLSMVKALVHFLVLVCADTLLIHVLFAGFVPSRQESERGLLEDLQHSLHWVSGKEGKQEPMKTGGINVS